MAFDAADPRLISIASVERDTGLSKDTLRIWERRYHFPAPQRDAHGDRLYPADQVEKLRLIRRLLDQGHRPSKVVTLPLAALQELSQHKPLTRQQNQKPSTSTHSSTEHRAIIEQLMISVRQHQVEQLRQHLTEQALRMGLSAFIENIAAPLAQQVGETWVRGELAIFEEHLFSESLNQVLRQAISTIPLPHTRLSPSWPKVLLTTFPQESHGLGLLMAEAIFTLEGARCISLGVQTPIFEITEAAQCQDCHIVALSFSDSLGSKTVLSGLQALREQLPPNIDIWAGGSNSVLQRRPPKNIHILTKLSAIPPALLDWRTEHAR